MGQHTTGRRKQTNRKSRARTPHNTSSRVSKPRHDLALSHQEYRQLFDVVPCYITVQGPDYRIVQSNALFRQDFGDVTGAHCFHAYKDRDDLCANCPVAKTFEDGKVHSSEETVVTRDGRKVELIVYSTPLTDEQGRVRAVMEVSTDITQVKQLQQQLVLVGLAVSGMAHRIKNIMMGLQGAMFVVNTGFEDGESQTLQQGWKMVERNVHKISHIAQDLLLCSKEHRSSPVADTSPKALIHEIAASYIEAAARNSIELRLTLGDDDDRGAFDPEAIGSVVANLLTNAIDACRFDPQAAEKKHVIQIRCQVARDGGVRIEVEDNGVGISREDSSHVFDGFFSTKGTAGTGLGLLVVQKVAREHGGQVTFESTVGLGTVFRVDLRPISD
jgi:PAS domain S-box-containing protein